MSKTRLISQLIIETEDSTVFRYVIYDYDVSTDLEGYTIQYQEFDEIEEKFYVVDQMCFGAEAGKLIVDGLVRLSQNKIPQGLVPR